MVTDWGDVSVLPAGEIMGVAAAETELTVKIPTGIGPANVFVPLVCVSTSTFKV